MLQYTQITDSIAELLFKHNCVIVPNFGGFVARDYSANFSKGNNLLFPPAKQILFNKNLIHNDGLLISALMTNNGLSYNEAEKQVTDYKDYIQSLLTVKKRFELNNIGLLYIDNESSLRFEAKVDVNFLLDSFGFEPVVANELVIELEKPVISTQFEDRIVSAITVNQEKQKKSYRKRFAVLAIAAPVTLAFLLFAAYSKPVKPFLQSSVNPFYTPEKTYTPNKALHNRKAFLIEAFSKQPLLTDANGFASLQLSDSSPVLVAAIDESITKIDKTLVHKIAVTHRVSSSQFDGNFQVVMGCFGVEQNADKMIGELNSKHVKAGISGKNAKGLFVVSCGGFNSKDSAVQLLLSIKADFPNAWIMAK